MTKRQEWLIATLKARNGAWMTEEDICCQMVDDILDHKLDIKETYNFHGYNVKGSHCPQIWDDMDKINQDIDAEAIIITKDRQFAIAMDASDVNELLLEPLMRKTVSAFKRYWNIKKKLSTQDQMKIGFTEAQEMKFIDLFQMYGDSKDGQQDIKDSDKD